jgi:hypothetical protein
LRAERHPNADLVRALGDRIGQHAGESDGREQKRQGAEETEEPREESFPSQRGLRARVLRTEFRDRKTPTPWLREAYIAPRVNDALNIFDRQRLQNTVDAGYLRPAKAGRGRGSERRYSFENVAPMQALEILVKSYGLSAPRAAQMLSDVWPRRFSHRSRVLVIKPKPAVGGVKLEPIKLPLSEIAAAAEARVQRVLARQHYETLISSLPKLRPSSNPISA